MRAAAKPVDAHPATVGQVRTLQCAVTDDSGAEKRREFDVGIAVGKLVRIRGGDRCVLRISAVSVPSGIKRLRAEVLGAAHAVATDATGPPQPGDSNPV